MNIIDIPGVAYKINMENVQYYRIDVFENRINLHFKLINEEITVGFKAEKNPDKYVKKIKKLLSLNKSITLFFKGLNLCVISYGHERKD